MAEAEPFKAKTELGSRLKQLWMTCNYLSENDFSRACGLTKSHMGLMRNSGACTSRTLVKIRRTTHVDLNWLVAGDGQINLKELIQNESEAIAARTRHKAPEKPEGKKKAVKKAVEKPPKRTPAAKAPRSLPPTQPPPTGATVAKAKHSSR